MANIVFDYNTTGTIIYMSYTKDGVYVNYGNAEASFIGTNIGAWMLAQGLQYGWIATTDKVTDKSGVVLQTGTVSGTPLVLSSILVEASTITTPGQTAADGYVRITASGTGTTGTLTYTKGSGVIAVKHITTGFPVVDWFYMGIGTFVMGVTDGVNPKTQSFTLPVGTVPPPPTGATLSYLDVVSSPSTTYPGSSGYGQVTIKGTGIGDIAIKKDGSLLGYLHALTTTWSITDYFMMSVGGPYTITAVANNTMTKIVTISATVPPPPPPIPPPTSNIVLTEFIATESATSGVANIILKGTGTTGTITLTKNGTIMGYERLPPKTFPINDTMTYGVGTWTLTASDGTVTKTVTLKLNGTSPPPPPPPPPPTCPPLTTVLTI